MANLSNVPAFVHDCENCRFLAHVAPKSGRAFDLYICEDAGEVVARTGSEGPDYAALPRMMAAQLEGTDSTMAQAMWLANRESWVRGIIGL